MEFFNRISYKDFSHAVIESYRKMVYYWKKDFKKGKRFKQLYNDFWIIAFCCAYWDVLVAKNTRDFEWFQKYDESFQIVSWDDFIKNHKIFAKFLQNML